MKIERKKVGDLKTNCYILSYNNNCLVVDPGDDFEVLNKYLTKHKLKVLAVLITHYHFDHLLAMSPLINNYQCELYDLNYAGQKISLEDFNFEILYTPGHSFDGVTYYFEKEEVMFTGDFLFKETIGRWDLPTGDYQQLKNSLKKLKNYSKEIKIYPGHGQETTLEHEFKNNKYFQ